MKKKRCPDCNAKMEYGKPDSIVPDGYYYCKHCPNMYKPISVDVLKE